MPGGGSSLRRSLLPLVAAVLVAASGAWGSPRGAVVPPAGAPSLDTMAVSLADLPAGAAVQRQGYLKQPDFALYYRRAFKPGVSLGRSTLLVLDSEVGLTDTADAAATLAAGVETVLRSKKGRRALALAALEDAGLPLTGLRIGGGGIRELGTGDSAFMLPLTLLLPRHVRLGVVLELVRVDRVVATLYLVGRVNTTIVGAEAARLVGVVASRITAGLIPANVTPPAIPGVPQVGATSTADVGSWTNVPTAFAVQWLRCDAVGAACAPIDGATASSYVPTAADGGATLEVSVVATNDVGSSQPVVSAPSAVVLAAPPPAG